LGEILIIEEMPSPILAILVDYAVYR